MPTCLNLRSHPTVPRLYRSQPARSSPCLCGANPPLRASRTALASSALPLPSCPGSFHVYSCTWVFILLPSEHLHQHIQGGVVKRCMQQLAFWHCDLQHPCLCGGQLRVFISPERAKPLPSRLLLPSTHTIPFKAGTTLVPCCLVCAMTRLSRLA